MKKVRKRVLLTVFIFVMLLCAYAVIDMCNIPSQMGLSVGHINWNVAGVICGNLVVIALFAITYQVLDKRNIQKELNRRRVAIYMMRAVLDSCSGKINMLKNKRTLEMVSHATDFAKPSEENYILHKLLTMPFENDEAIRAFASDGVISEYEYTIYHTTKSLYETLVLTMITVPGLDKQKTDAEEKFFSTLESAKKILAFDRR